MHALGVMLIVGMLSACAGQTVDPSLDAEAKLFRAQPDKACMYLLPSSGGSTVAIFMDGKKVGTLGAGDYLRMDVTPGTRVLYAMRPSPLPSFAREKKDDLTIAMEAGRCYFFRTAWKTVEGVLQEFRLYLEEVPANEAQQAVNVRWLVPTER